MTLNWDLFTEFDAKCRALGIEPPEALARGLELRSTAQEFVRKPHASDLLSLTDEETRDYVTALSIREHDRDGLASSRGLRSGVSQFTTELAGAVSSAVLPELDRMVEGLQTRFREDAEGLIVAAQVHGITVDTSPAQVVEREDQAFTAAYNAMKRSWLAIQPVVEFRILMSKVFEVSPTLDELRALSPLPGVIDHDTMNWSVAFTDGQWSPGTGLLVDNKHRSHLDWLALARGGLRLNTPTEVSRMLAERARPSLEARLAALNSITDQPVH